ncbi:MAG: hypothetical protein KDA44_23335 [Planctomycetales bacterium]|nr:hypothetical protein [Planctomycetales bacterium]
MSTSPPTADAIVPDSPHRESAESLLRWAIAVLELDATDAADGRTVIALAEEDREAFGGREQVVAAPAESAAGDEQPLAVDSLLGAWLLEKLRGRDGAAHARPAGQPMSVGDVSTKLFPAYTVDGGQFRLAGCQLTDHPFLRLTFPGTTDDPQLRHVFVAPDGSSVSEELVGRLGLNDLAAAGKPTPRIDEAAIRSLSSAGRRIAAKSSTRRDPSARAIDPLATTVAWVRHAEGRLLFEIGESSEELAFSGWARLLEPKPWTARRSGTATFHLAATDSGEIDAAEEMAVCQQSGRRVLREDLVTCSVTGRHVLPEFTEKCPVTGRPALRSEFAVCDQCGQRVSRAALEESLCQACRDMTPVRKDDPRLAWIMGEHRGLERWNRWRLAETETVYIARADGLTKRLLAVIDKESLAVRRLATAGRFAPGWVDATKAQQTELLH